MQITHVVTRLDVGGAQSHVLHLATAQHERGDRVSVVTGADGSCADALRSRGIDVILLPRLVRSVKAVSDLRALVDLDRCFQSLGPDVVHAHSSKAGILTRVVARRRRLPAAYTAHGWPFVRGVLWPQRVVSRTGETVCGRLWGDVICLTDHDRELARSQRVVPASRLHVVPNGIPDITPDAATAGDDGTVRITMVARFFPQKDHDGLLRAAATIRARHPWTLTLVGDGPRLGAVRALARELGVDQHVRFAGARDDVGEIMRATDIAVLWSRYEGLPLAVLEACRAGVPWVATDLPGTRAILGSSHAGILAADETGLADALVALIDDEALRSRMGAEGRRRYEDAFELSSMVAGVDGVYEQAMSRSGRRSSHRSSRRPSRRSR